MKQLGRGARNTYTRPSDGQQVTEYDQTIQLTTETPTDSARLILDFIKASPILPWFNLRWLPITQAQAPPMPDLTRSTTYDGDGRSDWIYPLVAKGPATASQCNPDDPMGVDPATVETDPEAHLYKITPVAQGTAISNIWNVTFSYRTHTNDDFQNWTGRQAVGRTDGDDATTNFPTDERTHWSLSWTTVKQKLSMTELKGFRANEGDPFVTPVPFILIQFAMTPLTTDGSPIDPAPQTNFPIGNLACEFNWPEVRIDTDAGNIQEALYTINKETVVIDYDRFHFTAQPKTLLLVGYSTTHALFKNFTLYYGYRLSYRYKRDEWATVFPNWSKVRAAVPGVSPDALNGTQGAVELGRPFADAVKSAGSGKVIKAPLDIDGNVIQQDPSAGFSNPTITYYDYPIKDFSLYPILQTHWVNV